MKKKAPKLHTDAKKTKKLTRKEQGFVADIAKGKSGTEAAKNNYDVKNDNTAAVIASENLRKPHIIASLADAFPDDLLQGKHLELLNSARLDTMTFPDGPKTVKEWEEAKQRAQELLDDYSRDEEEDEDTQRTWEEKREIEKARKLVLETECLSDEQIKEMLGTVGCTVKRIARIYGNRMVYFWSPDNLARDKALDKAYKIRGVYAAEKRELSGPDGAPLFNDEHRQKSDKALEDLID